ncbi:DUF1653 domain-containing protein [Candidatus Saccharibacteria bacterium]|nr:MAG: DUF1653 domain-containing protein [Candidatus Saccharibacteria bacterium]
MADAKRLWYDGVMQSNKNTQQLRELLAEATALVPVGSRWRHYKGGEYLVTAVAFDEESLNFEVIYSPIDAPDIHFARWMSIWLETVRWQNVSLPRFKQMAD